MRPDSMNASKPVFIIDTCIGGLSVVRSLHASERVDDAVFVADYAVNPLGVKSTAEIADVVRRWLTMAEQNSDTALIACNTLSVHYQQLAAAQALSTGLKQVVSMVDCFTNMVRGEADRLVDKKVLIIGTAFTASQSVYADLLKETLPGIQVATVAATDLERRIARFEPATSAGRSFSDPGLVSAIETTDVAILACTCFPLILGELKSRFPDVLFLDPGEYCGHLLTQGAPRTPASLQIRVTGDVVSPTRVTEFAQAYLGDSCVIS